MIWTVPTDGSPLQSGANRPKEPPVVATADIPTRPPPGR